MTLDQFAAANPSADPAETIRNYRNQQHLELLKSGEYDDLAPELDTVLQEYAATNGIEVDFAKRNDRKDLEYVSQYSEDPAAQAAARTYLAVDDPKIRDTYGDPVKYDEVLTSARVAVEQSVNPIERNKARRVALDSGDTPFAVFQDPTTGEERLDVSPALKDLAGNDEALAAYFEANPDLDVSRIPEIRQKLSTPDGFTVPAFQIDRQHDWMGAFTKVIGDDKNIARKVSDLRAAADKGTPPNEALLDQIDTELGAYGLPGDSDERKDFIKDFINMSAAPEVDEENLDNNIRTLSTGQKVLPMAVMLQRPLFDKVVESPSIPESQRTMLKENRDAQISALAPEMFKTIAANRPQEFPRFMQERKDKGLSNAAILDEWMANPENYSQARSFMGGGVESILDAAGALVLGPAAMMGSDAARKAMTELQKSDMDRRNYAQMFGKNLSVGYDIMRLIAPVAADVSVSLLTGGAATAAVTSKNIVKTGIKAALKGAVEAGAYKAFTRGAATQSVDQIIDSAGKNLANKFVKTATTASYLGTAFNRSAGSTYVQLYSQLSEEKNPDGSAKYTPEKAREIALNHGLIAGTMTAAITGGFSFLGAGGIESIYGNVSRKQMGRIFDKVKQDFDQLAPSVRAGLDVKGGIDEFITSVAKKAVRPMLSEVGKGFKDEALEEWLDQFAGYFNQQIATGDQINIADAFKQAGYAAMLGGVMGGTVVGINEAVSKGPDEAVLRRTALYDIAAKLDAASSPQTAEAVRRFAVEGFPTAPTPGGAEAPAKEVVPEGTAPEGTEQAPSGPAVAAVDEAEVEARVTVKKDGTVVGRTDAGTTEIKSSEGQAKDIESVKSIVRKSLQSAAEQKVAQEMAPADVSIDPAGAVDVQAEVVTGGENQPVEPLTPEQEEQAVASSMPGQKVRIGARRDVKQRVVRKSKPQPTPKNEQNQEAETTAPSVQVPPVPTGQTVTPSAVPVGSGAQAAATPEAQAPAAVAYKGKVKTEYDKGVNSGEAEQQKVEGITDGMANRMISDNVRKANEASKESKAISKDYTIPAYWHGWTQGRVNKLRPVGVLAVDTYGIQLPEGYVKQGELYVYEPTQETPEPEQGLTEIPNVEAALYEHPESSNATEEDAQLIADALNPELSASPELAIAEAMMLFREGNGPDPMAAARRLISDIAPDVDVGMLNEQAILDMVAGHKTVQAKLKLDTMTQQSINAVGRMLQGSPIPTPAFTEANSPVTKEIIQHGGLEDITRFLNNVVAKAPKHQKAVAKLILEFGNMLGTVPIAQVHLPNFPFSGAFIPETGQILINTAVPGPRGAVDTVLHELVHAAITFSILNPTPAQQKVLKRLDKIRENVRKKAEKNGMDHLLYGTSNTDEFFTHFMTSTRFQADVSALTPKGERNWVQVIIEAIKDLLNGNVRTQQDKVSQEIMSDMIEFTRDAAYEQYGPHAKTTDGRVLLLPAYHGTPHKVDRFSMSKIGTGEGAQAYGFGLYFAQDKGVADFYAKTLSGDVWKLRYKDGSGFFGAPYLNQEDAEKDFQELFGSKGRTDIEVVKVKEDAQKYVYQVELLVDDDQMLDWDLPLSEQSESVKDQIASILGLSRDKSKGWGMTGAETYRQITAQNGMRAEWEDREGYNPRTGQYEMMGQWRIFNAEGRDIGTTQDISKSEGPIAAIKNHMSYGDLGNFNQTADKEASKALLAAGIKGIRFLDGNSRSRGEGNYNFVIFDENDIQITAENGIPVTAAQATAPEPGPYGPTPRMDALMQLPEGDVRNTARFIELTRGVTPENVEQWRESNPEAYQELRAMREEVLRDAGLVYLGLADGYFQKANLRLDSLVLMEEADRLTESEIKKLERSVSEFGLNQSDSNKWKPIVVFPNQEGTFDVEDGNHRITVARDRLSLPGNTEVSTLSYVTNNEPIAFDSESQLILPHRWADAGSPDIRFQLPDASPDASPEESFNNEIQNYVTGNWPADAGARFENLKDFARAWRERYGDRIRFDLRGLGAGWLQSRRDQSGAYSGAIINYPNEGDITVEITAGGLIEASEREDLNEFEAKKAIALEINEEVVHAFFMESLAKKLGDLTKAKRYSNRLAASILDEAESNPEDRGINQVVSDSIEAYLRGKYDPSIVGKGLDVVRKLIAKDENGAFKWVNEVARQTIQARRNGSISEGTYQGLQDDLRPWMDEKVAALKNELRKDQRLGPLLEASIQETEALMDEAGIRFQVPTTENTPDIVRAIAAGFTPDDADISLDIDALTEATTGLNPVNREHLISAAVNRALSIKAGFDALGEEEVAPDERERLTRMHQMILSGNTLDSDIGFYRSNPTAMQRLVRFLTGAVKAAYARLKLRFDNRTAIYVDRMTRELSRAKEGYRTRSDRKMFDPEDPDANMQYGPRFLFAGEQAEMPQFRRDSLDTARAMAAAGKSTEEIRAVTGWFPGKYDGKMRWEIPDGGAEWKQIIAAPPYPIELKQLLKHPALYDAYPDVANLRVAFDGSLPKNVGGHFNPRNGLLTLNNQNTDAEKLSSTLHEIQHWVQEKEDFGKGTSPTEEAYSKEFALIPEQQQTVDALKARREELLTEKRDIDSFLRESPFENRFSPEVRSKDARRDAIENELRQNYGQEGRIQNRARDDFGFSRYKRTAGEIEARDIQARATLTPEQLAATAPYSSENIAPEDAIVLMDGGTSSALFQLPEPGSEFTAWTEVDVGNKLFDSDPNQKPRNWWGRMFKQIGDTRDATSAAMKSFKAQRKVVQQTIDRLSAKYQRALKEGADIDLLRLAIGSNRPMLTMEDELAIEAEFNIRNDEAANIAAPRIEQAQKDRAAARRRATTDEERDAVEEAYTLAVQNAKALQNKAFNEVAEWERTAKRDRAMANAERLREQSSIALEKLKEESPIGYEWAFEMRKSTDEIQAKLAKHYSGSKPELAWVIDNSQGVYLVRTFNFHRDPTYAEKLLHSTNADITELRDRMIDFFGKHLADIKVAELRESPAYADYDETSLRAQARTEVLPQATKLFEDYVMGQEGSSAPAGSGLHDIRTEFQRFMRKKDLPAEVLELLGEIDDPLFNSTRTFASVTGILFSQRMLSEIRRDGLKSGWLIDEATKTSDKKYSTWKPFVAANEKSQSYAPLAGLYAEPKDVEAIQAALNISGTMALDTAGKEFANVQRALIGAAGTSMGVMTLGSVGYFSRNIVGNTLLALAQGVNPISHAGWDSAKLAYLNAFGKDTDADVQELIARRILGDGTNITYLKEFLQKYREDPINVLQWAQEKGFEINQKALDALNGAGGKWSKLVDVLSRAAEFTETFQNPLIYFNEFAALMESGLYEGNEEGAKQEAARRTKMVTPGTTEVPQIITGFSKNPLSVLVAPFVRFKAEMLRTTWNTYVLAMQDIKSGNETMRDHGINRMTSALVIHGAVTIGLPLLMQAVLGISDEEDEAIRKGMPAYSRHSTFIYFKDKKTGELTTLDLSFANPFSFVFDSFTQAIKAGGREDYTEIPAIATRFVTSELLGEQIVSGKVMDVSRNVDESTGLPIYLRTDNMVEKFVKSSMHVLEGSYAPQVLKKSLQAVEATNRPDKEDEPFFYTPLGILVGHVAPVRPRSHKAEDLAYRAFRNVQKANSELWQVTNRMSSPAPLDPEDVKDIYEKRKRAGLKVWQDMYRTGKAFQEMGLSERVVAKQAIEAGLSKKRVGLAMNGFMERPLISPDKAKDIREIDERRLDAYREAVRKTTQFIRVD